MSFFAMTDIDYQLQNDLNVESHGTLDAVEYRYDFCVNLSNNVIKHSQAQTCRIHLFENQEKISDDNYR